MYLFSLYRTLKLRKQVAKNIPSTERKHSGANKDTGMTTSTCTMTVESLGTTPPIYNIQQLKIKESVCAKCVTD